MKQIALLIAVFITTTLFGQTYEYVYRNNTDSTFNCYLKVIPEGGSIRGLVIRDYSVLPDTAKKGPFKLTALCAERGLMTLYTTSSNFFPEFFCSDSLISRLDEMVGEVINEHAIPKENIFIGGISASGTRALRYAQYCRQGKSKFGIKIRGVFAVDSPLDLARFYHSAEKNKANFKAGMLWEAELMPKVWPHYFSGSPDEFPKEYLDASVFSHQDSLGGNAVFLKDCDIILYHEPDIDWWLKERGASYYDINSFDIAAFALKLEMLGNTNVKLVTTTGKGFDRDGNRKCHSWTIVDEEDLVNWITDRIE
ncbi:MAG TPA: hypothetical protein DIW47_03715 [Bacteroidetes bacterium]|nr:hypothetical protein [Bacteroidota bacterium]